MSQPASQTASQEIGAAEAADLLRQYDHILIVSHMRPDGDCLGSMAALLLALRHLGKTVHAYNETAVAPKWGFLPAYAEFRDHLPTWTPRMTVFVDCGSPDRVADGFQPQGLTLNIDHHLTNARYGHYNYIDIEACAVGEQIYHLVRELDVPLSPEIATGIYLSILTDTGSFRYSNTSPASLRIAAELLEAGADGATVAQQIYETRSRGEVALSATAFANMQFEFDGIMAWSELRREDYERNGGYDAEPDGLASDLRGIEGVEISCLFHEMPGKLTRAGFRGKGNIDCSAIAAACGGGGHYNASGAAVNGLSYTEAREQILQVMRREVGRWVEENKKKNG